MKGSISKPKRKGKYTKIGWIALLSKLRKKLTDLQKKALNLSLLSIFNSNQILFNTFTTLSYTSKGILSRMGKGKGKIKGYYAKVYANKIIVLIKTNNTSLLKPILSKFPFLFIKKL